MEMLTLRADLVEWRLVDDEVIALDLRTSRYLGLNPTAALLWETIAAGTTETDLVDRVIEAFDVGRDQATADVRAFVGDLTSRDLLRVDRSEEPTD